MEPKHGTAKVAKNLRLDRSWTKKKKKKIITLILLTEHNNKIPNDIAILID